MYREFEEGLHDGIILGDSGYPLRRWLMTPVLNPKNRAEERYNGAHRVTWSTLERCNGILKRRFHCLHGELRVSPARAFRIIASCIILHTRAVDYNHPIEEEREIDTEINDDDTALGTTPNTQGALMRQRLISNNFSVVVAHS